MIYVTHDQVEAMTMADKIVVLQAGVIEQVGFPPKLYRQPRNVFVAGFTGSAKMNRIEGAEARKHKARTIGIRPEHMDVTTDEDGVWSGKAGGSRTSWPGHFFRIQETGLAGTMTVRATGEVSFSRGDRIGLPPRADLFHKFDAEGLCIE